MVRDARIEHLLIERDHYVGLVAHIGHVFRPHSDSNSARTLTFAGRGLDFGGNDLDSPDAIAHLAAHQAQDLAAFLCTLAGVADYFDDMLVNLANAILRLLGLIRVIGRVQ